MLIPDICTLTVRPACLHGTETGCRAMKKPKQNNTRSLWWIPDPDHRPVTATLCWPTTWMASLDAFKKPNQQKNNQTAALYRILCLLQMTKYCPCFQAAWDDPSPGSMLVDHLAPATYWSRVQNCGVCALQLNSVLTGSLILTVDTCLILTPKGGSSILPQPPQPSCRTDPHH